MKKIIFVLFLLFPIVVNATGIKVDGVTYNNTSSASEAIKDGSTVVFESDFVNQQSDPNTWNILAIEKDNVTVNLNGHKVNVLSLLKVSPNASEELEVLVTNGTIQNNFGPALVNGGNMVLRNVTINSICTSNCSNPANMANGGYLSINDSVLNTNNPILNTGTMEIFGTSFTNVPTIVSNTGTLMVNGLTQGTGDVFLDNPTSTDRYVYYDWNLDKVVNASDLVLYRKYLAGAEQPVNNKLYANFAFEHKVALNYDSDTEITLVDLVHARLAAADS